MLILTLPFEYFVIIKTQRLVCDGGYICGNDLEIQWKDANQEHAQRHKDEDHVQDPKGRYYHPGVTVAVYDVLGGGNLS